MRYMNRIFYHAYSDDARLQHHLEELTAAGIDDVIFMTNSYFSDPAHLPLPEIKRRAKWTAHACQVFRDAGFGTGINVFYTMGHTLIRGDQSARHLGFQTTIDAAGEESGWCFCPLGEGFLDYVTE